VQYSFAETSGSIFEINTHPRLRYLYDINQKQRMIPHSLHSHPDIAEICFIRSGSNQCTVNDHTYVTETNDMIFINANTLHSFFNHADSKVTASIIGIAGVHLRGLESGQLLDAQLRPLVKTAGQAPLISSYFELLTTMSPDGKDKTTAAAASHLTESLLILCHQLIRSSKPLSGGHEYNLGLRIKEYIDEHYLEDLKLADIADALHVNAYYLSHTFKKILGYSPIQYMIHRRIGEAQNMLINTDLTVTEIALHCGYNNSNYFQVVFNSTVGMPPGKYRKAWRQ
jgi:AraC-like DNA-binding protein/mannose-6-phosphate isomerase-like protein (cupin superfamily)